MLIWLLVYQSLYFPIYNPLTGWFHKFFFIARNIVLTIFYQPINRIFQTYLFILVDTLKLFVLHIRYFFWKWERQQNQGWRKKRKGAQFRCGTMHAFIKIWNPSSIMRCTRKMIGNKTFKSTSKLGTTFRLSWKITYACVNSPLKI